MADVRDATRSYPLYATRFTVTFNIRSRENFQAKRTASELWYA
eukprot:gene10685-9377_t